MALTPESAPPQHSAEPVTSPWWRNTSIVLTRMFDIIGSAVGLLLLSPFLLLIAFTIKLNDGGPIFFLQRRIGRDLKPFTMLKFRTMTPNAERDGLLTVETDQRITRVGRLLRKYKLDELPQLINVLRGDMQFVGPRPEMQRFVEMFRAEYLVLLRRPPGITDPASIAFRNEQALLHSENTEHQYVSEILPQKLQLSLEYAASRDFISDIAVIFRTLFPVKEPPHCSTNKRNENKLAD
jgi:lipopolysaccharide/colanic/teichoic acid biosynthesis glycosyltransferase